MHHRAGHYQCNSCGTAETEHHHHRRNHPSQQPRNHDGVRSQNLPPGAFLHSVPTGRRSARPRTVARQGRQPRPGTQRSTNTRRFGRPVTTKWAGRKGSRWLKAQKRCMEDGEALHLPCAWCGQPINYEFTRTHPLPRLAGTADHIIGLAQGGDPLDPSNLQPMHRGCNSRKRNAQNNRKNGTPSPRVLNSRQW